MNVRTSLYDESGSYSGNSLCDERIYQPYMEFQETILVILRVIGNSLSDEHTY